MPISEPTYPLEGTDVDTLVAAFNNSAGTIGETAGKIAGDLINAFPSPTQTQIKWLRALAAEIRRLGQ